MTKSALPESLPNDAAVRLIADLGRDANGYELVLVPTTGLGPGLPAVVPAIFNRHTGRLDSLRDELERYRLDPARRRGTATATTLASFMDIVSRVANTESVIFARTEWPNPKLTAVIDYHQAGPAGRPRHGEHRVVYSFPVTPEFQAWIATNGKPLDQGGFAAFVEEHAAEMSSPMDIERAELEPLFQTKFATPAEMVQLARGLTIHVAGKVRNTLTLQSGESEIVFVEEHQDSRGEKILVPGLFMISIPVFLDGMPVRIPARLRYRAREGQITWFYQLYLWERWVRERVVEDLRTAAKLTGLPTFEGAPES